MHKKGYVAAVALGVWSGIAPALPVVAQSGYEVGVVRGQLERAAAAVSRGRYAEAVEIYRVLVNQGTEGEKGQSRLGLAAALSQMGEDEQALRVLEGTVADRTPLGQEVAALRGRLVLQLAEKALHTKGAEEARRWLVQYARLADAPDRYRYTRLMAVTDTYAPVQEAFLKVGVLLPVTGPLATLGSDLMDALSLAVLEEGLWPGTHVELKVYDVGSVSAQQAALMALNDGVGLIVGPLESKNVVAVAGLAKSAGVPVVGFSTDKAAAGGGAWLAGYLAAEQGHQVADYAAQAGHERVAALVPSNTYGYELYDAFKARAGVEGVEITKTVFYNPENVDLGASLRSLVGDGTSPLPFSALFVPTGAANLPLVASQLEVRGVAAGEMVYLGTALWQDAGLLSPSVLPTVRGATFAVPPRSTKFETAFNEAYGRAPLGLSLVAYTVGEVLEELAFEHTRTGQSLQEILVRPEGFYAEGGYLRFLPNGENVRGLSIVKIGAAQFEEVVRGLPLAPVPLPDNLLPATVGRGWFW
ncbi:MAG: hypothetical protein COY40_06255 [Alphaproteobacteria bacterium CG_4_10_14_0_8_um_filter_53_9]|nr:MAG: hypothetical protein COY40_06255 [Alphaproteobacteria bacterium CG_4_10_14_0_8_um_filter_53_9]